MSKVPLGFGTPSSVVVDPTGKYAFVGFQNATSSRVVMYGIDETTGALSSTPLNSQVNLSAVNQVIVDPSGKFVYATLSDGLVRAYVINDPVRGFLAIANGSDVGNRATNMAFDGTGRFLYVTNSLENTIAMFERNSVTGALTNPVFFSSTAPGSIATTP